MRTILSLLLIICVLEDSAAAIKIPKKLLGEYQCVIKAREIVHNNMVTTVAPAKVILYVYRYRIDLKIDDKLFVGEAIKAKKSKKKVPVFSVSFEYPFGEIFIHFDRKRKTARLDYDVFKGLIFNKK